jgi:hypothetical protein
MADHRAVEPAMRCHVEYSETPAGKRFIDYTVSGSRATPFGRTLVELRRLAGYIEVLVKIFPPGPRIGEATIHNDPGEALKWLADEHLIVKICSFLSVWHRARRAIAQRDGGRDVLQKLEPMTAELKRNRERFRRYRNKLVAHGQEKDAVRHPNWWVLEDELPVGHADTVFMALLCINLMARLATVYEQEMVYAAEEESLVQEKLDARSLKDGADVGEALQKIVDRVPVPPLIQS